jgi:hypothetical protein
MKQKDKKLQYVLLALVVFIWGTLIYNFMSWNGNEEYLVSDDYAVLPIKVNQEAQRDTFDILLDWSDPFKVGRSGRSKSSKSSSSSSVNTSPKKGYTRPAPPPIPGSKADKKKAVFPKVVYQGYSINDSQITRVRVKVGAKTRTLKLGQTYEKMTLVSMAKDSISLVFGEERKVFLKEKGY